MKTKHEENINLACKLSKAFLLLHKSLLILAGSVGTRILILMAEECVYFIFIVHCSETDLTPFDLR